MNRAKFEKSDISEFVMVLDIIHKLSLHVGYIGILQLVRTDLEEQSATITQELKNTSLTAYERAKGEVSLQVNADLYGIVVNAISQCMKAREMSMDNYEAQVEPLSPQYAQAKSH